MGLGGPIGATRDQSNAAVSSKKLDYYHKIRLARYIFNAFLQLTLRRHFLYFYTVFRTESK